MTDTPLHTELEGPPDDLTAARAAREPEDTQDATAEQTAAYGGLLEHNGYNAIRHEALGGLEAIGRIPLESLLAAVDFNRITLARMRVDPDPRAGVAVKVLETERDLLAVVTNTRRALTRLEKRQETRESITRR